MFSVAKFRTSAGFTLLEMIITLVIVGFIGVGGTYGLVYGVSIYRSIQGAEVIMPQIDVAMNVITQTIREHDSVKEIEEIVDFAMTQEALRLNGKQPENVILSQVCGFNLAEVTPFENANNKVTKVTLKMCAGAAGAKEKTFVFYVSSKRGE